VVLRAVPAELMLLVLLVPQVVTVELLVLILR
jgi:hypothetical protein